jgi:hypothetical protein
MFVVGSTVESTSEDDFYIIQNLLRFLLKSSVLTRLMWESLRLILLNGDFLLIILNSGTARHYHAVRICYAVWPKFFF